MSVLWGRNISREEIRQYCGGIEQLAGVRRFAYTEGKAAGLEAAEFKTGSGLRLIVLPGRGMDIGSAEYKGLPIAWRSPVGEAAAHFYEPEGSGFLRNFGGGLLVTCGLTYLGSPCSDNGEELGLHGRISNIPAEQVATGGYWENDDYIIYIEGKVREAKAVFGPNLLLHRRISARLGENRLFIEDVVENEGFENTPHMILYHINIGFPILDETAKFVAHSKKVRPRDEVAQQDLSTYSEYKAPSCGFPDTVFYHQMPSDNQGYAKAAIVNQRLNLGVYVRYDQTNLPNFSQWKFTNQGNYVAGLEPANCSVEGRDIERQRGTLVFLKPGEKRVYKLEIGVLTSAKEIEAFST